MHVTVLSTVWLTLFLLWLYTCRWKSDLILFLFLYFCSTFVVILWTALYLMLGLVHLTNATLTNDYSHFCVWVWRWTHSLSWILLVCYKSRQDGLPVENPCKLSEKKQIPVELRIFLLLGHSVNHCTAMLPPLLFPTMIIHGILNTSRLYSAVILVARESAKISHSYL